jgi:MFS-type transporter involved in bile tolerance (Atg22 family)
MATDAAAALLLGRLFDRHGPAVLTAATALTALASPLVLVGGTAGAWLGMALWGVGMGAQESVMRATVALLVPADRRGTGFGLLNMVYGCAWFGGSVVLGLLYERGAWWAAAASFALQAASLPLLLLLTRRIGAASAAAQHALP